MPPQMKYFSNAIKAGLIRKNVETIVYPYQENNVVGIITEQWLTGCFDEKTIVKTYINNETVVSIDFKLSSGHGIGFTTSQENNNTPGETKRIGHTAAMADCQIPFINSVRRLLNYPFISIANLILPTIINNTNSQRSVHNSKYSQSSNYCFPRLNVCKLENILLSPLEFLAIANVSNILLC